MVAFAVSLTDRYEWSKVLHTAHQPYTVHNPSHSLTAVAVMSAVLVIAACITVFVLVVTVKRRSSSRNRQLLPPGPPRRWLVGEARGDGADAEHGGPEEAVAEVEAVLELAHEGGRVEDVEDGLDFFEEKVDEAVEQV